MQPTAPDPDLVESRPRPSGRRGVLTRLDDAAVSVAVRTGVSPRAVVGLLVVALAVVLVLATRFVVARSAGRPVPLAPEHVSSVRLASGTGAEAVPTAPGSVPSVGSTPLGAQTPGVSPGATSTASTLFVHVVGQVRRPGVVRLAAGSRVQDAVRAAGGARSGADLAAVNLARLVVDGEQIVVPRPGETVAPAQGPPVGGADPGSAGAAPVDLNAATPEQLDALPGVGPVLAGRIIDFRTQHGRFTSVDELSEVSGIGDTVLERLRPLVRV
jgi:competence protein ComEA